MRNSISHRHVNEKDDDTLKKEQTFRRRGRRHGGYDYGVFRLKAVTGLTSLC